MQSGPFVVGNFFATISKSLILNAFVDLWLIDGSTVKSNGF